MNVLGGFHPAVASWFQASFPAPTRAQLLGWPPIVQGANTLLLAPTGSGKTLAAFLTALDRLMFSPQPPPARRCRVVYVSPLKALAVDVERNLRAPLAGIAAAAERAGATFCLPTVGIRTGDTPQAERARMARAMPDILITTPESLFLLLTSRAREGLLGVETVIVDEIHALVGTKRGAHLFLSLERLEALRAQAGAERPLQRLGLSATQRPLDEIARALGGGAAEGERWTARPVQIVDAGHKRQIELRVEVPVDDMSRLGEQEDLPGREGEKGARRSIWPAIYPRLVELVRAHRSTILFCNSRRLSERIAGAVNELAGEELAQAHHGSVAREQRQQMEDALKRGALRCIVATSTLELGIDMGAVELVVQVESPPSVSSGLQRLGRARHQVGGVPEGVLFPKHRADLLASAAAAAGMRDGAVEATYYPKNPLDVLAQQVVAIAGQGPVGVDALFALVRGAAPFAALPRSSFEGVLDLLAGRYPSDEFAELRPRLVWDRVGGTVRAKDGAVRVAIANAGTIPDRGLYGVFLAGGEEGKPRRVGELDEEMVFESRVGEVFVLGASSWRIEQITHDRVLVSPAPGQPGKMPFWHGDQAGRPREFGERVGRLSRELSRLPAAAARARLTAAHGLDARAAKNLVAYLHEQLAATGEVPSDQAMVVERCVDEMGDFRVCVLTPFGGRVHAPWATAVVGRLRDEHGLTVEHLWSDEGMVFRFPEGEAPPASELFFPAPDEIEDLVVRALGQSALFAARFRENAARALLLPRRHPGRRSPLWAQRKRAADLLAVAQRYASFPILLETYRECLRDVFDLPGLTDLLARVADRRIRVVTVDSQKPSPFAASVLFSYVASFIYDGDAPLAERRAQALSVDQAQLRELLGEAELRELLDADAVEAFEEAAQRLDLRRPPQGPDGLHDLLRELGDLSPRELEARLGPQKKKAAAWLAELAAAHRAARVTVAGEARWVAAEDLARYRDALGCVPPPGTPQALLERVADPLGDLVSRFARTHGPFRAAEAAARFGLAPGAVRSALLSLLARDRVVEGELLPARLLRSRYGAAPGEREWCDVEVLRALKRRSLARLRREVEPVEPAALARFALEWQGVARPARGLDALLDAVERLQGAPLPASALDDVLGARVQGYRPQDLDLLCAEGEVAWRGLAPLGSRDGRLALYLTAHLRRLAPPAAEAPGELQARLRALLRARGASFFADLQAELSAFAGDLVEALWDLVWAGEATNDTLAALRARLTGPEARRRREERGPRGFRSRRAGPPGSEGRWSLLPAPSGTPTERAAALAQALLARHGLLAREAVHAEGAPGGFTAVYEVLKGMEQAGRARRGYFVAGLGATQFALPGAEERLRALREVPAGPAPSPALVLAATDPANPYGATLPWPAQGAVRPQRAAGAEVVLRDGRLIGWLAHGALATFLAPDEPERGHDARALARALAGRLDERARRAVLVERIDGAEARASPLAPHFAEAGFSSGQRGLLARAPQGQGGTEPTSALGLPEGAARPSLRPPRGKMRGPLGPDLPRTPGRRGT